ncbi:NAD(P)-binding protein [Sandaracinobacter sp. RS1-74]|uniref:oxidoreductase n=1 Tax=Sandaracinobacteroides sayramensis TaxID=2913411 RepID=UPI001EDB3110|nr:FAD-dependent oxidoreductase [Sandaracinobacteroides sayramensis]MCG2841120.1 NAD(P)-binding protein [Sandaracinobacteroides sayramensis]
MFPHLLQPIRVGGMAMRNRVAAPPHAAGLGNLLGSEAEADRYIAYWQSLAAGGTGLLIALNGFLENHLPPGFDPQGIGARRQGVFRNPLFVERMGRLAERAHGEGACVGTQIIIQGGMPHGPSQILSGPVIHQVPHALTRREIAKFVAEYRFSAEQALAAGLDCIELHANHDDLIEWFLSPITNQRTDSYGGSFERRMAFLHEILLAIREGVGDRLTVGVRLNMAEAELGGYNEAGGLAIAQWVESTGLADYLGLVMGTGWGFPSYIQTHHFAPGQWAETAGRFRRALKLPIFHAGRIADPATAEAILAAGHCDVVAVGRAHLADSQWVAKATAGRPEDIRPCIACNECISRPLAENLPFACTVNPALGADERRPPAKAASARRLLVVGGGPAGMELAATAAERGHQVELWEAGPELGGQMRLAANLPSQDIFLSYLGWQERRLDRAGVRVVTAQRATPEAVMAAGADIVAIATGSTARRPQVPGADLPHVVDFREVAAGRASLGKRVAIVVEDDHVAPLATADRIARDGHQVSMFIATHSPAPLVSRYSAGTWLGRLSEAGVEMVLMQQLLEIEAERLRTRHVYSGLEASHGPFDSVVLACGGVSDSSLFSALDEQVPELHILGDAYAPRRVVHATQQGRELAKLL